MNNFLLLCILTTFYDFKSNFFKKTVQMVSSKNGNQYWVNSRQALNRLFNGQR